MANQHRCRVKRLENPGTEQRNAGAIAEPDSAKRLDLYKKMQQDYNVVPRMSLLIKAKRKLSCG